jgi:hypothetical protein
MTTRKTKEATAKAEAKDKGEPEVGRKVKQPDGSEKTYLGDGIFSVDY